MAALVDIRGLSGYFKTYAGHLYALNDVNLTIEEGKITGLVGETGSGKSITALSILRLLPESFVPTSGEIWFRQTDLTKLSDQDMQRTRGNRLSMVFQDARAALNPVFTVGEQLMRVARQHSKISSAQASARAREVLARVQIPDPARISRQYPHELSGGMAQRVMIAMALIHSPELVILDEPTTSLDVTIQVEILDLVRDLVRESGVTVLLITHDLGVVAETCHFVAVMYAGRIMEYGTSEQIFSRCAHPYTRELLRATLSIEGEVGVLYSIPGTVPDLRHRLPGCAFALRCADRAALCDREPPFTRVEGAHFSRCHFAADVVERAASGKGVGR
jgi:peptide/nickel transport system ATP-binding protein